MAPPRPQPISHTPIRPRAVCRESGPWSASHSPASMFPSAYLRLKARSHDALFVFPNCTKCVLSRPAFPSQRPRAVRTCRPCILRRRRLGASPFQRLFSPPFFVDSSSMRSQCAADHPTQPRRRATRHSIINSAIQTQRISMALIVGIRAKRSRSRAPAHIVVRGRESRGEPGNGVRIFH